MLTKEMIRNGSKVEEQLLYWGGVTYRKWYGLRKCGVTSEHGGT